MPAQIAGWISPLVKPAKLEGDGSSQKSGGSDTAKGRRVLGGGARVTPDRWVREDEHNPQRRPQQDDLPQRLSGGARARGRTRPWASPGTAAGAAGRGQGDGRWH